MEFEREKDMIYKSYKQRAKAITSHEKKMMGILSKLEQKYNAELDRYGCIFSWELLFSNSIIDTDVYYGGKDISTRSSIKAPYRSWIEFEIRRNGKIVTIPSQDEDGEMFGYPLGASQIIARVYCFGLRVSLVEDLDDVEEFMSESLELLEVFEESRKEGSLYQLLKNVRSLMEKMNWSLEKTMELLSVSDAERIYLLENI